MTSKTVTPEFRGSFVNIARAKQVNNDGDPKFSIMVVLDPEEDDEHDEFLQDLEDDIDDAAMDKWGSIPKRLKSPIKEGDDLEIEKTRENIRGGGGKG